MTNSKESISRSEPLHIAVPLYIYPGESSWNDLVAAVMDHPSACFDVIINPHNGPGGTVPDSTYIAWISRLNSLKSVKMYGYVHTLWGKREISLVKADIDTYEAWAKYPRADIHVAGIFLDEAPSSPDLVEHMREIYLHAKSSMTNGCTVWTNPGVPVDARYFGAADLINTFENTYEEWKAHNSASEMHLGRSTVMIHTYDAHPAQLERDTAGVSAAGYHGVLITTMGGYEGFSKSWHEFVRHTQN